MFISCAGFFCHGQWPLYKCFFYYLPVYLNFFFWYIVPCMIFFLMVPWSLWSGSGFRVGEYFETHHWRLGPQTRLTPPSPPGCRHMESCVVIGWWRTNERSANKTDFFNATRVGDWEPVYVCWVFGGKWASRMHEKRISSRSYMAWNCRTSPVNVVIAKVSETGVWRQRFSRLRRSLLRAPRNPRCPALLRAFAEIICCYSFAFACMQPYCCLGSLSAVKWSIVLIFWVL